jgi:predicted nucleic acid-binding Zn ribbon protein
VGPEIARHARPTLLRGSVLEASVDSSVWCQQIQLRGPEILAALREILGPEAPRDLRLRVG